MALNIRGVARCVLPELWHLLWQVGAEWEGPELPWEQGMPQVDWGYLWKRNTNQSYIYKELLYNHWKQHEVHIPCMVGGQRRTAGGNESLQPKWQFPVARAIPGCSTEEAWLRVCGGKKDVRGTDPGYSGWQTEKENLTFKMEEIDHSKVNTN